MGQMAEQCEVSIAIFFWLNVPPPILKKILAGPRFSPPPPSPHRVELGPGIAVGIGPPREPIATFNDTVRIEYLPDRFMLSIKGPLDDVIELFSNLPSLFEDYGYKLADMCRYCEINTELIINIEGYIDLLRQKVRVTDIESLAAAIGEKELGIYQVSFSNMKIPLSDQWLNITLTPDPNAPLARTGLRIVKRCRHPEEVLKFLKIIKNMPAIMKEFLQE